MAKAAVMSVLHNVQKEYPDRLREEIFAAIGDIKHIEPWGEEILVAPFVQDQTYGSGKIIRLDSEVKEDRWQSKSFLIIKLGTSVEKSAKAHGLPVPVVGEWYYGNVQEHWMLSVRGKNPKPRKEPGATSYYRPWGDAGWPCRHVLLADIRGKNPRPQDIM